MHWPAKLSEGRETDTSLGLNVPDVSLQALLIQLSLLLALQYAKNNLALSFTYILSQHILSNTFCANMDSCTKHGIFSISALLFFFSLFKKRCNLYGQNEMFVHLAKDHKAMKARSCFCYDHRCTLPRKTCNK